VVHNVPLPKQDATTGGTQFSFERLTHKTRYWSIQCSSGEGRRL